MSENCEKCGTVKYFNEDKRRWVCYPCDEDDRKNEIKTRANEIGRDVKRYEIFDRTNGGYDIVERDTGEWVRADDFDALAERNADLEKTVERLLLLYEYGGRVILKEV